MKIYIEKGTSVDAIKKIFTTCYPYLRIELYKNLFNTHNAAKKEALPQHFLLDKYIHSSGKAIIDINHDVTVAGLEHQFKDVGLTAKVFRKSGNVWIGTSLTDNWTLQQQNAEAEEISKEFNSNKVY
jgi:hypothetical protein